MLPEKYLKLNLKNKIFLSLTGFLLATFALIYFVVVPTINDIKAMSKNIEEQKIELEKKYIKGQSLKKLTENLKEIEPKLNLLDQIFINKNRDLEFITALENQANKNQISQKINLSAPQTAENNNFQKNNLQLLTDGNFLKQLKYVIDLELLAYYINVKIMELTPSSGRPQTASAAEQPAADAAQAGNINIFLSADTYWQ